MKIRLAVLGGVCALMVLGLIRFQVFDGASRHIAHAGRSIASVFGGQPKEDRLRTIRSSLIQPTEPQSFWMARSEPSRPRFRNEEIRSEFIAELARIPQAGAYFESLGYLGTSEDATTVRMWLSLGLSVQPTRDQTRLLRQIALELKSHSEGVMNVIEDHFAQMQIDFFTEQMALPLVNQLEVARERKAGIYGKVLEHPLSVDALGTASASSSNVTTALMYLRETRLPTEKIWPHLEHALSKNQDNPRSYGELGARILAYFPEIQIAH